MQGARQKPLIHWVPALVDNIRFYHMGIAAAGIVEGWGRGAYGVVVGASTAAAVDTAAAVR